MSGAEGVVRTLGEYLKSWRDGNEPEVDAFVAQSVWMRADWTEAQRLAFRAGRLCASCMGEATADRWGGFVIRHRMPCPRSVVVRNGRVEVGAMQERGS